MKNLIKNVLTIAVLSAGTLMTMTEVDADPLIFTESTRNELQVAYQNRDMPLVAWEYANTKMERFCKGSNAHKSAIEWKTCMTAIAPLALGEKMIHLGKMAELAHIQQMQKQYEMVSSTRY